MVTPDPSPSLTQAELYFRFTPVYLRRLTNAGLDPTWISKKIRDMGDNGLGHVPAGIAR